VLDLGCGEGRHALYLATKGFDVTAIDRDIEKLSEFSKNTKMLRLKIKIIKNNIATYHIFGAYDLILANMSLHFLKKKQIDNVVEHMKKHTKVGGLNVVGVLTRKEPKGYRPHLFKENELKSYYKDWKVLQYNEGYSSAPIRTSTDVFRRQHRAIMIARKEKML